MLRYQMTGELDEDNNPVYGWVDDGEYDTDPGVITGPGSVSGSGGGIGGLTGTGGDASIGFDWNKWSTLATKMLGAAATPGGVAALATGLYGTLGGGNRPSTPPGWRGTIDPNAMVATRTPTEQTAYTPYSGQPVMGRRNFSDMQYTPRTVAAAPAAPITPAPPITAPNPAPNAPYEPVQSAAQGGIMGLAVGGRAKNPRYLEGATDGMADKISTSIDGNQPAALSHGEFVIPADVVSHLGNGNSKAGAAVLYKMMDRVRHARTGNKKQGKEINPAKFTPGGIAGYAGGGVVAFAGETGSLVGAGQGGATSVPVSSESNLSSWAGPGIADYIQRGTALSQSPYQAYTGPLTAGSSPLQQQGFGTASTLQAPSSIGQAAQTMGNVGTQMGALSYDPTQATNQYTGTSPYAAANIGNQYTGTGAYTPIQATNQYTGTSPYTASNITTGQFGNAQAQQYMNPYLQASLDPQLAEARRQSEITQMGNAARLTQAGAYGGSRGALMQSETQRNLGSNLANITGQGYNTAFTNAMGQFNADQARQLNAQQGNEASRQFGAQQALTNAQQAAQYGQSAQAQNAQQQQFGAQQALTNAQNAAQYGLAGLNATEASRQFGAGQVQTNAQQAAQFGQQAQAQNMQQQQFGANYGLQGLQGQLSAAQAQGGLGVQQSAANLANLNAQLNAGATQRGIEQEGLGALKAQFEEERQNPYKQVQFAQSLYQGLPVSTTTASTATTPLNQLSGIGYGMGGIYDQINKLTNTTTP